MSAPTVAERRALIEHMATRFQQLNSRAALGDLMAAVDAYAGVIARRVVSVTHHTERTMGGVTRDLVCADGTVWTMWPDPSAPDGYRFELLPGVPHGTTHGTDDPSTRPRYADHA